MGGLGARGTDPQWSHSGRQLFCRDGAGNLVAHEVQTTPTFSLGRSTALFAAEDSCPLEPVQSMPWRPMTGAS